ncbi:hypothetical protein BJQ91_03806 [Bacillus amyloliquefaciens]|nr:hypothetical protein [Bacillus amyloliquefaciens]
MDAFLISRGFLKNGMWSDVVKYRILFYLFGDAVSSSKRQQRKSRFSNGNKLTVGNDGTRERADKEIVRDMEAAE